MSSNKERYNKIHRGEATAIQKEESRQAAIEARKFRQDPEAGALYRRMIINTVYRRTRITDEAVLGWLFVGMTTMVHMATGTTVPLAQIEARVTEMIPDLHYYNALVREGSFVSSQEESQKSLERTEEGLSFDVKLQEKKEASTEVMSVSKLQKGSLTKFTQELDNRVTAKGEDRYVRYQTISTLQLPEKKVLERSLDREDSLTVKATGHIVTLAPRDRGEATPHEAVEGKRYPKRSTNHYPPELGDDKTSVPVPAWESPEVLALSVASYQLPYLLFYEEKREREYACIQRTHDFLVENGKLTRTVLSRKGIFLLGSPDPEERYYAYIEHGRLKISTADVAFWRGVHWNERPYEENTERSLWKMRHVLPYTLGMTKMANVGKDASLGEQARRNGFAYHEWMSWERLPNVEVMVAFHALHHAGLHIFKLIDQDGPPIVIVQEHASELSQEQFDSLHLKYGDHPRYLTHFGTPALKRSFKNYVLVHEERRPGKDMFLYFFRTSTLPGTVYVRGVDPGRGWKKNSPNEWYRTVRRDEVSSLFSRVRSLAGNRPFALWAE